MISRLVFFKPKKWCKYSCLDLDYCAKCLFHETYDIWQSFRLLPFLGWSSCLVLFLLMQLFRSDWAKCLMLMETSLRHLPTFTMLVVSCCLAVLGIETVHSVICWHLMLLKYSWAIFAVAVRHYFFIAVHFIFDFHANAMLPEILLSNPYLLIII